MVLLRLLGHFLQTLTTMANAATSDGVNMRHCPFTTDWLQENTISPTGLITHARDDSGHVDQIATKPAVPEAQSIPPQDAGGCGAHATAVGGPAAGASKFH